MDSPSYFTLDPWVRNDGQFLAAYRTPASKRLFDLCVGLVLLVLSSPLILTLALLVRLTSRGPALYRQQRVGKRAACSRYTSCGPWSTRRNETPARCGQLRMIPGRLPLGESFAATTWMN